MSKKIETIHCSRCLRLTKHVVLVERHTEHRDDVDDEGCATGSSGVVWILYECQGCENVVLRRRFWHTDMERGESESERCYNAWHPPLISRQIPEWHKGLVDAELRLISEVYIALHAEALALATMGVRALLDMYIVRKVGDVGSFKDKLRKLQECGVPRHSVWNLTARIHRSGARWGLWGTRYSELSTNPRGGVLRR